MDILDEVDTEVNEKKSKWKYTPMREKSETDAIIDELLKEFPSEGYESVRKAAEEDNSGEPEEVPGEPENLPEEKVAEPESAEEDEVRPRPDITETYTDDDPELVPVGVNLDAPNFVTSDGEVQPVTEEESADSEKGDDNEQFNEYISQKYVKSEYSEPESEQPPDEEEDEDEEEYDDEYDDGYGEEDYDPGEKTVNTPADFNSFMDAENDGEKGDISDFSLLGVFKTILKILVLAAFGAFAVVGVINIVGNEIEKYDKKSMAPEETLKETLCSVIYPLIVTRTDDFENVTQLSDEQLVNISVWEIIINGSKSVFKDADSGGLKIPADQIDYVVDKLFGTGAEFSHTDSKCEGLEIKYSKKDQCYLVPDNTDLYTFYPVVTDIADTGNTCTVYADCYSPDPSWNKDKSGVKKRVMVTMTKTKEYYNFTSMKTIPIE